MSFTIDLEAKNKRIWYPGDILRGSVILKAFESVTVERITLYLEGITMVTHVHNRSESSHERVTSKVPLFRHEIVLLEGPFTVGQPQQWPFELHLPLNCNVKHVPQIKIGKDGLSNEKRNLFNTDNSQSLPPSSPREDRQPRSSQSEVSYRLRVKAFRTSGLISRDITKTLQVQVMPFPPPRIPESRYNECTTFRQVGVPAEALEGRDREKTLGEKLKTAFRSETLHAFKYDIQALFPDTGFWGQVPPVFLSVPSVTSIHDDAPDQVLPMKLTSLRLYLCRKATVITQSFRAPMNTHDSTETIIRELEIADWSSGSHAISSKAIDLRSIMKPRKVDWRFTPPDYSTFNIHMQYHLRLEIVTDVANRTQTKSIQSARYRLLSPFTDGPPQPEYTEEQLPAYPKDITTSE